MDTSSQNNILITLPVNIAYSAIEGYLKENFTGKIIKDEKENGKVTEYAKIMDMALAGSTEEDFDIVADITFKNLTSLFRNKIGRILLHLSLEFNEEEQEISVINFKLDGKTGNWLMNNSIEAMANTFLHNKIKTKMIFNFRPIIEKQLTDLNKKLEDAFEVKKGINLYGNLKDFRIHRIIPKIKHFYVLLNIEGDAVMDIEELNFQDETMPEPIIKT